ncbi:MAG: hypothetical protein V9H26_08425 [Verrucomicrobiota bacterium]
MRIFASLAVCSLAFLCSCNSQHYVRGRGDAGQFILQRALAYGGRPFATDGLPAVGDEWQYVQDEFGVGILLPASQYQPIQDFLRVAFGPPSNSAGWSAQDFGVAIMVQKEASNTVVGVHPPMSEEKMVRAVRKITETIERNTR